MNDQSKEKGSQASHSTSDAARLVQEAQRMDDYDWALERVTRMCASALVDAQVYRQKLLKGFGYPNEVFSRAQDYRALNIILSALQQAQARSEIETQIRQDERERTLRTLASATRKVLSPELVKLVEAEMRRGLASQVADECGNWTPLKAAEVAAPRERIESSRFAWLMERQVDGAPAYWDGGHAESFTRDPNKAVQFAREEDARNICSRKHYGQWGWKFVEHGFIGVESSRQQFREAVTLVANSMGDVVALGRFAASVDPVRLVTDWHRHLCYAIHGDLVAESSRQQGAERLYSQDELNEAIQVAIERTVQNVREGRIDAGHHGSAASRPLPRSGNQ